MAAHDHLQGWQFQYEPVDTGASRPHHVVSAFTPEGKEAGHMRWSSKQIWKVHVGSEYRRQGVATAMWEQGQQLASENSRIPVPKHSADRSDAGDAWAKSVGGRLPRRLKD